jgi:hypothetical protein
VAPIKRTTPGRWNAQKTHRSRNASLPACSRCGACRLGRTEQEKNATAHRREPTPPPLQAYEGEPKVRFRNSGCAPNSCKSAVAVPFRNNFSVFRAWTLFHTVLPPIDTISLHSLTSNTSKWLSPRTPRCVDQSSDVPRVDAQYFAVGRSICSSTQPSAYRLSWLRLACPAGLFADPLHCCIDLQERIVKAVDVSKTLLHYGW